MQEYAARLARYARFELVELPEAKGPPARAMAQEGEAILAKLGADDWLVALDARGKMLDSVELARFVASARDQGRDLAFAVGGDEGHSEEVLRRARLVLSLGKMTLPHRLARVVIAEQLYRAFTILRGEPYHK